MITYGPCADGRWRIRRPGSPFIVGSVYEGEGAEERCRKQAMRFANGGRCVQTVFPHDFVDEPPPAPDEREPTEEEPAPAPKARKRPSRKKEPAPPAGGDGSGDEPADSADS